LTADLLIGGTLGAWALRRADSVTVAQVVTDDPNLAGIATALGLPVRRDHDYQPARRGLSVHYQRIVPAALIDAYDGLWNLHPGLLPWGRGMYPVFWALWERTPAGATLHELVPELDAGPIVDQEATPVREDDTGGSLHARVQDAERRLFDRWWSRIVAGDPLPSRPQPAGGTSHRRDEFLRLRDGGGHGLTAAEVERLRRCLEFPGYPPLGRR
jgi:hypothetical protein